MLRLLLLISLFTTFPLLADEKALIAIYTYHLKPPLITDVNTKKGLYFDFTNRLNSLSEKYQFETIFVPRKRIDRMLENNNLDGILLGVNPLWFNDTDETKFLWTSRIFTDRDEVISLASHAIEYSDKNALKGKVFGGVRGFYYYGINELVSKNEITRVDTVREEDLFTMLLNHRINSAIVSRSTFDFLVKYNNWQGKFYLSKKPHDIFDRRILVPKANAELYQHIEPLIETLQFDKSWQALIAQYK